MTSSCKVFVKGNQFETRGNQQILADANLNLFATNQQTVQNPKHQGQLRCDNRLQASQIHRRTLRIDGRRRKHAWLLAETKQPKQAGKGEDGKTTSKKQQVWPLTA